MITQQEMVRNQFLAAEYFNINQVSYLDKMCLK